MHSGSLRYSEADEAFVTAILSKAPQGVFGVGARNEAGEPAVILNLPLQHLADQWQPFPTLYWLVDPDLRQRLAELERKGVIGEIEAKLAEDDELMQQHLADNKLYAKSRWASMNKDEQALAIEQGFEDVLRNSGVGGVANHASIKCLHAQYAFHLARHEAGTTVGRILHRQYGI